MSDNKRSVRFECKRRIEMSYSRTTASVSLPYRVFSKDQRVSHTEHPRTPNADTSPPIVFAECVGDLAPIDRPPDEVTDNPRFQGTSFRSLVLELNLRLDLGRLPSH